MSDGLSTDLLRVGRASGFGCEVDGSRLRPSRALSLFCKTRGEDPADRMLKGGEDYALVLSVSPGEARGLCAAVEKKLKVPAAVIGRFTKNKNTYWRDAAGKRRRLRAAGWDHLVKK